MSTSRRVAFLSRLSRLITKAEDRGIQVTIFWYNRTSEQQQGLYAQGRTEPGKIVTNCDGINVHSKHEKWEAADLCIIDPVTGLWRWDRHDSYEILGDIAEELGLRWGGNWDQDDMPGEPGENDAYHFELP